MASHSVARSTARHARASLALPEAAERALNTINEAARTRLLADPAFCKAARRSNLNKNGWAILARALDEVSRIDFRAERANKREQRERHDRLIQRARTLIADITKHNNALAYPIAMYVKSVRGRTELRALFFNNVVKFEYTERKSGVRGERALSKPVECLRTLAPMLIRIKWTAAFRALVGAVVHALVGIDTDRKTVATVFVESKRAAHVAALRKLEKLHKSGVKSSGK
jgi:hypothetical protein